MKKPIDNFSVQAKAYKKYRPQYPQNLYDEVLQHVCGREKCWDCGTGNGQVAQVLSRYFKQVEATDISQGQLDQAGKKENIHYSKQRAESTNFGENEFDLITVGQAVHWFDHEAFNREVKRVGKAGGIVSLWGYGLLKVDAETDKLITEFDSEIVGPYWDVERRHIDEEYQTIPFDFEPIAVDQSMEIEAHWTWDHLQGYFNSWSCVQNYIQQRGGENPVPAMMDRLKSHWTPDETKRITFPIFMKMGRIRK